jgi:hypothetical protein
MRTLILVVISSAILAFAACSDGNGESGDGSPTPLPSARVRVEPTVVGQDVTFSSKGYAAQIPEGWSFDPNAVVFGDLSSDLFLSPSTEEVVQPNIAVTCETIEAGVTLNDFMESKLDTLRRLTNGEIDPPTAATAAGQDSLAVEYDETRGDVALSRRDIFMVRDQCAWSLSLTTAAGGLADYEQLFDTFVANFKFI